MGGRYYITGVQIGMLMAMIQDRHIEARERIKKLLKEIEENQFMCASSDALWINLCYELQIDVAKKKKE